MRLRPHHFALQESFETADLRTLTDDEIKPHSQHPLPGLSRLPALPTPAQPKAQPPLPAVPAVPGATPEQVLFQPLTYFASSSAILKACPHPAPKEP